jgi:hypothetical protein
VLLLLCGVAITPLLRGPQPCTHDGGLHYFRVVAMRHALNDGIVFTRFLPNLAFGYGYPFFNYRAALSYYLALLLYLTGLSLPVALNGVYVLSILGAAGGAYLLARDIWGHDAGLVAAVAYAYAPYQFLDALVRGNMPESVALALLPSILWAFRRLALTGRRRWFLLSIGGLAALYLTHNISTLLFTPFLVVYLAALWLAYPHAGHWLKVGGALTLAVGLTAFFIGPALLEQDYVQLHLSRTTRNNDFHYNFVSLAEILSPPRPVDTSLLNPPMRVDLGLAQTVLAGLGLVGALLYRRGREQRVTAVFMALAAAAMLWMSTARSVWMWEQLPLIAFVQFPWRLVGRAILPVALLAGAAIPPAKENRLQRFQFRTVLTTLAIGTLILLAIPDTYPQHGYCPAPPRPSLQDLYAHERETGMVGVDPEGSYFPVGVDRETLRGSPLEAPYTHAETVPRFDETALPAGATILEARYGTNRAHIVVDTPVAFRARYLAFDFPGWQVRVDGEPVAVTPTEDSGLITFRVPPGRHTIRVRFRETRLRLAFDVISALSLGALLIVILRHRGLRPKPVSAPPRHRPGGYAIHVLTLLLAVALLVLKLGLVDRTATPWRRPFLGATGTLPGVQHPLMQDYADGLTLIGYDQNRATLPADGVLRFDIYWTTHAPPGASYQSVIHLVGPDGQRWSKPDSFRPRGYADYPPTPYWPPDRYAMDSQVVEPLPGTPPDTYDVVLTVFDADTLTPLSVLNDQGQPAAPELTLGQVTLTRPRQPYAPPEAHRVDLELGPFTLLSAAFDRHEAAPGDAAHLTLMWRASSERAGASPCDATLTLGNAGAPAEVTYVLGPSETFERVGYKVGDIWRTQHPLLLPATLESGTYRWAIAWCDEEPIPIGTLRVDAPPHTFQRPPVERRLNEALGEVATLTGVTVEPEADPPTPGDALEVTLVWRAETTPQASYHVFVHLLDSEGRLVAQSDAVPAAWDRPTTGWLAEEYIVDAHTLRVPEGAATGEYALVAGLYVPHGERLRTSDGTDAILLKTVTVEGE